MEDLVPIVAIIVIFGSIFGCIPAIILILANARVRREMQATLRASIDKGQPLSAEAIEAMVKSSKPAPTSVSDVRKGVIWAAVGVGVGVLGFLAGYEEADAFRPMLGLASIPFIIGLAYIVLSFLNPNKGKPV